MRREAIRRPHILSPPTKFDAPTPISGVGAPAPSTLPPFPPLGTFNLTPHLSTPILAVDHLQSPSLASLSTHHFPSSTLYLQRTALDAPIPPCEDLLPKVNQSSCKYMGKGHGMGVSTAVSRSLSILLFS